MKDQGNKAHQLGQVGWSYELERGEFLLLYH